MHLFLKLSPSVRKYIRINSLLLAMVAISFSSCNSGLEIDNPYETVAGTQPFGLKRQ